MAISLAWAFMALLCYSRCHGDNVKTHGTRCVGHAMHALWRHRGTYHGVRYGTAAARHKGVRSWTTGAVLVSYCLHQLPCITTALVIMPLPTHGGIIFWRWQSHGTTMGHVHGNVMTFFTAYISWQSVPRNPMMAIP